MILPNLQHYLQLNLHAIKGIPANIFWFLIGIFALFALNFFYRCYKNFVQARVMQDTPTAKIRSAAQGYTELKGRQHSNKIPTIAPLTKLPCTWYRYTIQYMAQNRQWQLVEQGESQALFTLDDDTGKCIISPQGAQITTQTLDSWVGFARFPKNKPKSFLMRLLLSFGRYRYTEWRMEDNMPLYAIGNFRTLGLNDPFLAQSKTLGKQLQLLNEQQAIFDEDNRFNILTNIGLNARDPFLLSARDQNKIIRSFKIDAFIWFVGYVIVLVILAACVVIRLV